MNSLRLSHLVLVKSVCLSAILAMLLAPAPAVSVSTQPAEVTTSSATPAAETIEKSAVSAGTAPPNAGAAISLPALYVLGDSTAANNPRSTTVQGWGTPFLAYFNPTKINVINAARGGRSAHTYITEGLLDVILAKLKPGDIVLIQFGHNDAYDINGTTSRGSLHGVSEETEEIDNKLTHKHEVVHTFGWYLRKFVDDIRSKGAQPIILTLTICDRWNKDGTIERLPVDRLDLSNTNRFHEPSIYSNWSAEVAKTAHVPLLDVHNCIADRYEREGPDIVATYFNSPTDPTHRNPKGAAVDSELTLAALKTFEGLAFDGYLSDQGRAVAAADTKYVFPNAATGK